MTSSQPPTSEPSFPTQSDLRAFVAAMRTNPLAEQLFFDASRCRVIVDLDGVVIALNDFAAVQLGADPQQVLDRPIWADSSLGGDPLWEGRLRSRFAEALAAPGGTLTYEERIEGEGRPPQLARVRLAVITSDEGTPLGFLVDSEDIGREHRSRAIVREQQRLLHVVFERTFQLIAILDPDGTVIDVNHAVERIGLTPEQVIGRTVQEIGGAAEGPARAVEWQERIDAMQTAVEPRRYFDVRDLAPDGPRLAADISMTPVREEDGTLVLILLEFREQTERFEAEQRLRESEERFRALAETQPQMVWATGTDGLMEYFGPRWVEFTGLTMAELHDGLWVKLVHPDDRAHVTAPPPNEIGVDRRAFRMRDRTGNYRWMESESRGVVDEVTGVSRWYGATLDVTERREAEVRFRSQNQQIQAAAELAGLGSFIWTFASGMIHVDEGFRRLLGVTGEDWSVEMARQFFVAFAHPDDQQRVQTGLLGAMVFGGPNFSAQLRMRLDGPAGPEERWIACAARVEFDDDQQPVRMIGAIQDVTTNRRQDDERIRLQKVEAIGTLVGAIAHDFNNVIGAILTYARIAEVEMAAGEQPTASVAEIARGARRAADILGRLMAFGREETPQRLRFDAAEIVEEAVALVRPAMPDGATVEVQIDPQAPPLDGDPTQIHQVLVNLISNAAQAIGHQSGGSVTVRGVVVDLDGSGEGAALEPGRYLRITVQDNGPGFQEGTAHRLFDPYFTTKATGKGTGLGLAAVQSIVRAHHGSVTAQSPAAGGALFTVLLPVVADARPRASQPKGPRQRAQVSAPPTAPKAPSIPPEARVPLPPRAPAAEARAARRIGVVRALVVDDEPALVRLASRAMPYRDIEVSGHIDANEALAAFEAAPQSFDVLVTDLSMPVMSGFELIDRVRAIRADLPVVLTSGFLGSADALSAERRAIDAVLPKPCSIEALAAAVLRVTKTPAGDPSPEIDGGAAEER